MTGTGDEALYSVRRLFSDGNQDDSRVGQGSVEVDEPLLSVRRLFTGEHCKSCDSDDNDNSPLLSLRFLFAEPTLQSAWLARRDAIVKARPAAQQLTQQRAAAMPNASIVGTCQICFNDVTSVLNIFRCGSMGAVAAIHDDGQRWSWQRDGGGSARPEGSNSGSGGGDSGCDHPLYCNSCIRQHLTARIFDSRVETEHLACPDPACRHPVPRAAIKALVTRPTWDKYNRILTAVDSRYLFCPLAGCGAVARKDELTCLGRRLDCKTCGRAACVKCGKPWHVLPTCSMFANVTPLAVQYEWWSSRRDVKRCPKCSYLIEKNGGCSHMTCRRCKHEFCWHCKQNHRGHIGAICPLGAYVHSNAVAFGPTYPVRFVTKSALLPVAAAVGGAAAGVFTVYGAGLVLAEGVRFAATHNPVRMWRWHRAQRLLRRQAEERRSRAAAIIAARRLTERRYTSIEPQMCPVDGCREWFTFQNTLDAHLSTAHNIGPLTRFEHERRQQQDQKREQERRAERDRLWGANLAEARAAAGASAAGVRVKLKMVTSESAKRSECVGAAVSETSESAQGGTDSGSPSSRGHARRFDAISPRVGRARGRGTKRAGASVLKGVGKGGGLTRGRIKAVAAGGARAAVRRQALRRSISGEGATARLQNLQQFIGGEGASLPRQRGQRALSLDSIERELERVGS